MIRVQIDIHIQREDTDDSTGFALRVLFKVKEPWSKAKAIFQHHIPSRTDIVRIYLTDHRLNPANKGQFGGSVSVYPKTCCYERQTRQDMEVCVCTRIFRIYN